MIDKKKYRVIFMKNYKQTKKGFTMKKVVDNPVQDKISKSMVKALFSVMNECLNTARAAADEEIKEYNNNHYTYKLNFNYIKKFSDLFDSEDIFKLFSEDDKEQLKHILNQINTLSEIFNKKIDRFNEFEKSKNFFERARLKKFKAITMKHFEKIK